MSMIWTTDRRWEGVTAAVLGSGRSLTPEAVYELSVHPCIAVNEAILLAPDADMLVGLDGNWPQVMRDFEGEKLCGIEDDTLDAYYIGHRFERVRLAEGHVVDIRNSGLAAIRIAAELGASRILLAGFDAAYGGAPGHFYDDEVDTGEYVGLAAGLRQITAELAARGVRVERFELPDIQLLSDGE